MRAVLQRVEQASVRVHSELVGSCGHGLLILLGVGTEDTEADKRDVCAAHGLMYPPREFMEWYFADDGMELKEVLLDSHSTLSLGSGSLTAGARVLVAKVSGTYVILGRIY